MKITNLALLHNIKIAAAKARRAREADKPNTEEYWSAVEDTGYAELIKRFPSTEHALAFQDGKTQAFCQDCHMDFDTEPLTDKTITCGYCGSEDFTMHTLEEVEENR